MSDLFGEEPQTASRFDEFWDAYPSTRKTNKKGCKVKWKAKRLDGKADTVLEDVRWRSRYHRDWVKEGGKFVPQPSTYLNQERWNDDRDDVRDDRERPTLQGDRDLSLIRGGVVGMILKRYDKAIILETFGIDDNVYELLLNETTTFSMPGRLPGDPEARR